MKLIDGKLYLTWAESQIKQDTLYKAKQRQSKGFVFAECSEQGKLVQYDALDAEYKVPLLATYKGDPYKWYQDNNFASYLKPAPDALAFFAAYKKGNGLHLDKKYIDGYTKAAQVLDVLKGNKKLMGEALAYIASNGIMLPKSEDRLTKTLRKYLKGNFECLISGKQGNQCAAKEKNEALIRQLQARPQNISTADVADEYNTIAQANGLPVLSERSILRIVSSSQVGQQIEAQRRGMNAWRNKYDLVIDRTRPEYPLYMTVHDGFDWELYYQKKVLVKKAKKVKGNDGVTIQKDAYVTRHHFRKNVVVVVDAFNDYPLGYAIGDGENSDLMRQALRNAALHVFELTGGYHLQHEIKCDNFGTDELKEWFGSIAPHVSPSKVGNARDKVIESWFKRFNDSYTNKHLNYAGKNADALKKNQPNRDFLDKYKNQFPDEQGVIYQICQDIERDRESKREAWLQAWANIPADMKREVTRQQYLEIFGTYRERTIQLTNIGIALTHKGKEHKYLLLEHDFLASIGNDIRVVFDEATPHSIVAIDEKNNRKWLVEQKFTIPMARVEQREGDRTKLNMMLNMKDAVIQKVIDANSEDMSALDAEGIAKGFFTYNGANKGVQAEAKRALADKRTALPTMEDMGKESTYHRTGSMKVID